MAGDWLKMESSTPEKAEVMAITARLGWEDTDLTVGKLFRLWRWFDQQTVDGNARSVTSALLDRVIGVTGFCAAVAEVGWLDITESGISLPKFDRHNGTTAKSRALTSKRVQKHKGNADGNGVGNAKGNGVCVTSALTAALPREEKRREEEKTKESRANAPRSADRFDDFWDAYPSKKGRKPAADKWRQKRLDIKADEIISDVKRRRLVDRSWIDGYVPNPATYLQQERWTDEINPARKTDDDSDSAPDQDDFMRGFI